MRLELDTVEPLVDHLPALGERQLAAIGRKHVRSRQRYLAHLFSISHERRRPHAVQRWADSFERNELVTGLRASRSDRSYKRLLEPFYEFTDRHGYSKSRRVTKAYFLREDVWEAMDRLYSASEPLPLRDVDSGLPVARMPDNGLPRDVLGELFVPGVVPLSVSDVDRAIALVTARRMRIGADAAFNAAKPNGLTVSDAERLLMVIRRWVQSVGGIPNLYRFESTGRLGPSGCHLIGMPSLLRPLLLNRSGLFDYDLVACHWSILVSLSKAIGFDASLVEDYVSDRGRWIDHWVCITGHGRRSDFKAVATSWLTGGTLSASELTSSGRLVGKEVMKTLREDPKTRALYDCVRKGMAHVRAEAREERDGEGSAITNAVGAVLRTTGSWRDRPSINSHLLTGYEQFAIREAAKHAVGVQAIIYDGFIAPQQDVAALEQRIRARSYEELAVTLQLTLAGKDLSHPVPDYH